MRNLSPLKIAMVQTDLFWKDKVANLAMLEEKIWGISEKPDLIILPEMFSTGFSMDASELAEPMNLTVTKWMRQLAAQTGAVLTGSLIVSEGGKFFNRLLWVAPEGKVQHYDKRHLFRMADEEKVYSPGGEIPVFELKGWKVCPQICYDLRFPVWSRNRLKGEDLAYDLIFYVASWPAARIAAWDTLLPARAIENLAYSIGVNRVGTDGNFIVYNGHSTAYDFKGQQLVGVGEYEGIAIVELNGEELTAYRNKFPAWMDSDSFQIQ